jgi:hypothetical protein
MEVLVEIGEGLTSLKSFPGRIGAQDRGLRNNLQVIDLIDYKQRILSWGMLVGRHNVFNDLHKNFSCQSDKLVVSSHQH